MSDEPHSLLITEVLQCPLCVLWSVFQGELESVQTSGGKMFSGLKNTFKHRRITYKHLSP